MYADVFVEINSFLSFFSVNSYSPRSFFMSSDLFQRFVWTVGHEIPLMLISLIMLVVGAACAAYGAARLMKYRLPAAIGPVLGVAAFCLFLIPGIFALAAACIDFRRNRNRTAQAPQEPQAAQATPSHDSKGQNMNGIIPMYMQYWRRAFDFSGRVRRRDFWLCTLLINLVVLFLLGVLDVILAAIIGMPIFVFLFSIATLIPTIAISVRRLHDIGKSGFWYLLILVPLVGVMVLFVFACLDSQPGDNVYGANPKGK
jgi:uncharacterized membrane protein YhaH (DUF805 family)